MAPEPRSSLHQDELPSRRGTGTVDSDMYTDDEDAEDEDPASRESSVSPTPAVSRPSDPTLIPWARDLGVDRQKMHVMQTSLFRVPEEEAALKSISQQPARPSSKRLALPHSLTRKHSRDSDGEGLRADSRQVSYVALALTRRMILTFIASFVCRRYRTCSIQTFQKVRKSREFCVCIHWSRRCLHRLWSFIRTVFPRSLGAWRKYGSSGGPVWT